MKKLPRLLSVMIALVVISVFCLGRDSNASLIGDVVSIGHYYSGVCYARGLVTIEEGVGDLWTYDPIYSVNVEADNIYIEHFFTGASFYTGNPVPSKGSPSFNGLIVSGLDCGAPIVGMTVETNWGPLRQEAREIYGDDYVGLNFEGLTIFDGLYFNIALILADPGEVDNPTPEPSTLILLGMGVLGVGVIVRKKFCRDDLT